MRGNSPRKDPITGESLGVLAISSCIGDRPTVADDATDLLRTPNSPRDAELLRTLADDFL